MFLLRLVPAGGWLPRACWLGMPMFRAGMMVFPGGGSDCLSPGSSRST